MCERAEEVQFSLQESPSNMLEWWFWSLCSCFAEWQWPPPTLAMQSRCPRRCTSTWTVEETPPPSEGWPDLSASQSLHTSSTGSTSTSGPSTNVRASDVSLVGPSISHSVHWSSLTTVGVFASVSRLLKRCQIFGDGDVILCSMVHRVITVRWLLMLHSGNCDSSEAPKLYHTGEAGGAQWQSKLRIQQPTGPQNFSSDWGWLGFQHQEHLEHFWRPKDLIEIFCQVQRRTILVTWS